MILERAMKRINEAFPFEVYKAPLKHHVFGESSRVNDTKYYGLFRDDNNEQVSDKSVSESYVPHTTADVRAIVEQAIKVFDPHDGCLDHINAWFNKGHYVCIAPSTDYRKRMHRYDHVYPRAHVYAGLGGLSSVRIRIGWWREKCGNLAMPRLVDGISLNIRHSKSLPDKLLEIKRSNLFEGWSKMRTHMDKMQDNRFNFKDAMHTIFGEAIPRRQRSYEARMNAIASRIMREKRQVDHVGEIQGMEYISGWELYNGVQGYYQHDAPMKGRIGEYLEVGRAELDSTIKWKRMVATANNKYVLATEQLAVSA